MTKKNLVIGFVLDDGLDSEDGVQKYILTLGKHLQKFGHEVHYIVGETKRNDIVNIHSLSKNLKVNFNGNKMSMPLPVRTCEIDELFSQTSFDILHIQMPYSPFYGGKLIVRAKKLGATKTVATFHILPYSFWSKLGSILLGLWLKPSIKYLDKVVSVSKPAKQFAKKYYYTDSSVVPNMVDIEQFQSSKKLLKTDKNSPVKLLFLGRLVERKGCQYLVEALAELEKTNPDLNYHLDICGRGPLLDQIQQKVTKYGLASKVTFHGFVSEKEKINFMQNTDMSIFPSVGGESFGIVLIEAMAAGGMVLAGDNPGYASVLEPSPECLFDPKNTQLFSHKLKSYIQSLDLREKACITQQAIVKKFDTTKVVKQILKIYYNES